MTGSSGSANSVRFLVGARLREFFDHRTAWHRALWQISAPVGLEEVAEYADAVAEGHSSEGLAYVCNSMRSVVQHDRGLGDAASREQVKDLLSVPALSDPVARDELRHRAHRCRWGYLRRWADALRDEHDLPPVERCSRHAASHLLDQGMSGDHLHGWLQSHLDPATGGEVPQWLEDADAACARPAGNYEVLVPVTAAPPGRPAGSFTYLEQADTLSWLEREGAQGVPGRPAGALLVTVEARDPWSAVRAARDLLVRAHSRIAVGISRGAGLATWGYAWVRGKAGRLELIDPRRRLLVPTLDRQGIVYDVASYASASAFDDALELAAQLPEGTPGAAVSGAWAAVESQLRSPGEPAPNAADRMADIIACSFPRAELTQLAHRHREAAGDELSRRLQGMSRMRHQVAEVGQAIIDGGMAMPPDPGDQAALARFESLVTDPGALRRVRRYVAEALRRLYNQRNLVMHGGYLRSVALTATLRTAPPLIGAGLDRIAHGLFSDPSVERVIQLAARAKAELAHLDTGEARPVWALLDEFA